MTAPQAVRRIFELVAESGTSDQDLNTLFAALTEDFQGALDAAGDEANMPLDQEPAQVNDDLEVVRGRAGI
ncbi:MAG: hypothetical protein HOV84_23900 [Streptomyces sp.]|nr:hypothetical protein [Streptomyces sp.]